MVEIQHSFCRQIGSSCNGQAAQGPCHGCVSLIFAYSITKKSFVVTNPSRYPFVYAVSIIPLTIVRWIGFGQIIKHGVKNVPAVWDFVVITLFGLSGFFNVILLLNTRPDSGLFGNLMFTSPVGPPSPLPLEPSSLPASMPSRVNDDERLPY